MPPTSFCQKIYLPKLNNLFQGWKCSYGSSSLYKYKVGLSWNVRLLLAGGRCQICTLLYLIFIKSVYLNAVYQSCWLVLSCSTVSSSSSQLNMQAPYVRDFAWSDMVHGCFCMVYTELAPRRQQFQAAPAMLQPDSACKYTTSVVFKMRHRKSLTHSESHATRAQWVCSRAENSAI